MSLLRIAVMICAFLSAAQTYADEFIIVQSTTSTRDSGLYEFILPQFQKQSGIQARVVSVGTGQAIRNARDCNGDVLLVHSKSDEEKFVAEGYGIARHDVMYNDFILIGPEDDPAKVKDTGNIIEALQNIANSSSLFASRGDDSGTNKAEMRLWKSAGIDAMASSGKWYLETGSGMGKTISFAVGKGTYTLADRATWSKFSNKGTHQILKQGEPPLFNQYGVTLVNQEKCPNVKSKQGQKFVQWIISDKGQKLIAAYTFNGEQLFFPNAVAKSN